MNTGTAAGDAKAATAAGADAADGFLSSLRATVPERLLRPPNTPAEDLQEMLDILDAKSVKEGRQSLEHLRSRGIQARAELKRVQAHAHAMAQQGEEAATEAVAAVVALEAQLLAADEDEAQQELAVASAVQVQIEEETLIESIAAADIARMYRGLRGRRAAADRRRAEIAEFAAHVARQEAAMVIAALVRGGQARARFRARQQQVRRVQEQEQLRAKSRTDRVSQLRLQRRQVDAAQWLMQCGRRAQTQQRLRQRALHAQRVCDTRSDAQAFLLSAADTATLLQRAEALDRHAKAQGAAGQWLRARARRELLRLSTVAEEQSARIQALEDEMKGTLVATQALAAKVAAATTIAALARGFIVRSRARGLRQQREVLARQEQDSGKGSDHQELDEGAEALVRQLQRLQQRLGEHAMYEEEQRLRETQRQGERDLQISAMLREGAEFFEAAVHDETVDAFLSSPNKHVARDPVVKRVRVSESKVEELLDKPLGELPGTAPPTRARVGVDLNSNIVLANDAEEPNTKEGTKQQENCHDDRPLLVPVASKHRASTSAAPDTETKELTDTLARTASGPGAVCNSMSEWHSMYDSLPSDLSHFGKLPEKCSTSASAKPAADEGESIGADAVGASDRVVSGNVMDLRLYAGSGGSMVVIATTRPKAAPGRDDDSTIEDAPETENKTGLREQVSGGQERGAVAAADTKPDSSNKTRKCPAGSKRYRLVLPASRWKKLVCAPEPGEMNADADADEEMRSIAAEHPLYALTATQREYLCRRIFDGVVVVSKPSAAAEGGRGSTVLREKLVLRESEARAGAGMALADPLVERARSILGITPQAMARFNDRRAARSGTHAAAPQQSRPKSRRRRSRSRSRTRHRVVGHASDLTQADASKHLKSEHPTSLSPTQQRQRRRRRRRRHKRQATQVANNAVDAIAIGGSDKARAEDEGETPGRDNDGSSRTPAPMHTASKGRMGSTAMNKRRWLQRLRAREVAEEAVVAEDMAAAVISHAWRQSYRRRHGLAPNTSIAHVAVAAAAKAAMEKATAAEAARAELSSMEAKLARSLAAPISQALARGFIVRSRIHKWQMARTRSQATHQAQAQEQEQEQVQTQVQRQMQEQKHVQAQVQEQAQEQVQMQVQEQEHEQKQLQVQVQEPEQLQLQAQAQAQVQVDASARSFVPTYARAQVAATGTDEHNTDSTSKTEAPGTCDVAADSAAATPPEPSPPHSLFLFNVLLLLGLLVGMQDDPIVDIVKLISLDGPLSAIAGGRAAAAIYTCLGLFPLLLLLIIHVRAQCHTRAAHATMILHLLISGLRVMALIAASVDATDWSARRVVLTSVAAIELALAPLLWPELKHKHHKKPTAKVYPTVGAAGTDTGVGVDGSDELE